MSAVVDEGTMRAIATLLLALALWSCADQDANAVARDEWRRTEAANNALAEVVELESDVRIRRLEARLADVEKEIVELRGELEIRALPTPSPRPTPEPEPPGADPAG